MSDLKIDYSLSNCEKALFPIIPAYGLRHLRKEGWQNKAIGIIELCPVLGAIVALIERLVAYIFKSSATEKLEQIDISKWKEEFKENVRANFNKPQSVQVELALSKEQEEILKKAVRQLNTAEASGLTMHSSGGGVWVFSVNDIPGRIFKMAKSGTRENRIYKRVEDTAKAQQIIDREGLYLLHVPVQKIIQLDLGNKTVEILMEQKFELLHGHKYQHAIFKYCLNEPELKPFLQECVRQLIMLIIKTGYRDVRYDNNPILSNGQGMALIDMDISDSVSTGLLSGCGSRCDDGILSCLSLEMLQTFEPLLKQELTDNQFQDLHLKELKNKLRREAEQTKSFPDYLQKHNIQSGKDPIKFGPRNPQISELEMKINKIAVNNLGLCLLPERKFYVHAWNDEATLNRLKKDGNIFDYRMNAEGYYVWC